jgi:protein SCO1/2
MTTAPPANPETARKAERGRRRRLAVIGAVVVVVLFAAALVIGQSSKSSPKPPGQQVGSQLDDAIPASIANLPLTDENGHQTSLAAFKGKIVVVNPFMTLCQEICPITTAELNQVDEAVTKAGLQDKVAFLNITIDPERDTPQRLHAYRDFAQLLPNWSLLTASPENLKMLWSYFGVGYQRVSEDAHHAGTDWLTGKPLTYDVTHSDVTTFLDPQGHRRYVLQGMPLGSNAPLTSGERAFLNDEGRANLADTASASWDSEDAVQVVGWLADKHIKPVG